MPAFTVFDTMNITPEMCARYLATDFLEAGLWLVLNPNETQGVELPEAGTTLEITTQDNNAFSTPCVSAEIRHGVIALRILVAEPVEVKPKSRVYWE